jgi:hypothetical protein
MREKRRVHVQYLALPCHSLPAKFGQHNNISVQHASARNAQNKPVRVLKGTKA